jgi:hypothetical protein
MLVCAGLAGFAPADARQGGGDSGGSYLHQAGESNSKTARGT